MAHWTPVQQYGPELDYIREAGGVSAEHNALMASMHPKQLAFFSDPSKAKTLLGGRQGGKTWGVSLWLIADWKKHPGKTAVYITRTAKAAAHRCWPQLKKICAAFGIRCSYNNSDLIATFPNGYKVWCTGCKDRGEADKIRGEHSGFIKIAIDEPATFSGVAGLRDIKGDDLLEYICTEVAEWTLLQTNGDLLLCGTPGPIPAGFWFDICMNPAWSHHCFTALDNPFLPGGLDGARVALDAFCTKYGYTYATPKVRREFFAEWCLDTEALVYMVDADTFIRENGFWELPTKAEPDFTTLGVDLGYDPDPCAFVVSSSWRKTSKIWTRRAYSKGKLTPDLVAMEINKLKREFPIHRVRVDGKGGGKTTAKAITESYGVIVEAGPGGEKRPKIDLMRGGLNSHNIMIHLKHAQELVAEYRTIVWDDERANHHDLCFDHCADAHIEACMPHAQFAMDFQLPEELVEPMSPEKLAAFEEAARQSSQGGQW